MTLPPHWSTDFGAPVPASFDGDGEATFTVRANTHPSKMYPERRVLLLPDVLGVHAASRGFALTPSEADALGDQLKAAALAARLATGEKKTCTECGQEKPTFTGSVCPDCWMRGAPERPVPANIAELIEQASPMAGEMREVAGQLKGAAEEFRKLADAKGPAPTPEREDDAEGGRVR